MAKHIHITVRDESDKISTGSFADVATPEETAVSKSIGRIYLLIEDRSWLAAQRLCDKVLEQDYKCADVYLAKLLIQYRAENMSCLLKRRKPLEENTNFVRARRYGTPSMVEELDRYAQVQTYLRKRVALPLYTGVNVLLFLLSIVSLLMIGKFRYNVYADNGFMEWLVSYEIAVFISISVLLLLAMTVRWGLARRRKYGLLQSRCASANMVTAEDFESFRVYNEERTRKHSRRGVISFITTALLATVAILLHMLIPAVQYNTAAAEQDAVAAYMSFLQLGDYKDAKERAQQIAMSAQVEMIRQAQAGDTIYFGAFEQDGKDNGTEAIEWLVLEKTGSKVLVTSKYGLTCAQYYDATYDLLNYAEYAEQAPNEAARYVEKGGLSELSKYYLDYRLDKDAGWKNSALRTWLNGDFLSAAFTEEQRALIPVTTVKTAAYAEVEGYGKNTKGELKYANTTDRVYLLSVAEVEKYFQPENVLLRPTISAIQECAYYYHSYYGDWWLRDTGLDSKKSGVAVDKEWSADGWIEKAYVRPAMWIDISQWKN